MDKSSISKISLYAFYVVSISNLINQVVHIEWIDLLTKPLLMITLLVFYLSNRHEKSNALSKLVVGALVFSWFGDVFLMLQGRFDGLFIPGLAAFLAAHILYIFAYQKAKYAEKDTIYGSFIKTRIAFLLLIGAALIYMLYPVLGDLRIPVIIYTLVIISMGISALLRRGRTLEKSFVLIYSGALMFIMSDAMLGINKFLSPLVQSDLLIMATYIAAQFLIIKGILIHENTSAEEEATTA